MSATSTCFRCGAPRVADESLYCRSCGAKQAAGVGDLAAYRLTPERFDLVAAEPAYAAAMQWRPRLRWAREVGQPLAMLGAVSLFTVAALWVITLAGFDGWFRGLFGGIGGVTVIAALVGIGLGVRRVTAKSERVVAVVIADRVRGPEDRAGVAAHRVMLRVRDGKRRDALADAEVMSTVVAGDIGIAYLQHDRLADFRRFEVMPAPLPAGEPAPPPVCSHCAAPMTFEHRTDCGFCGEPLPEPDLGEHGARFSKVAADRRAQAALQRKPRGGMPSLLGPLLLLGLGAGLVYLAWMLRVAFVVFGEDEPRFFLVLIPILLPLLLGAVWLWRRTAPRRAPLVRFVGLVMRVRREIAAAVSDRPVYRYFVLLGGATGARRELRCSSQGAQGLKAGQMGVAFLRGALLVELEVIDEPVTTPATSG